jgi:DNA invertase Pin-like site-specific DNA recombinase
MTGAAKVLGYVRVSTDEQANSRLGLNAQRVAIAQACIERGWEIVEIIEDAGYSGKTLRRPGIQRALLMLEGRRPHANALVVAKLDRLSRSLLDFATAMERAQRKSWQIVAIDQGFDMTTTTGRAMAGMVAVFAQWERELIGERTKAALAVRKAQGTTLGRPRAMPEATRARIKRMRSRGMTLAAIAAKLNHDEVPTAHGGARWHASTVRAVLGMG